jgi:3'-5' exoribonuclease
MKKQFVNQLQEGDVVNDYFIAVRKDLRSKQDGGLFLGMVFKDKTGDVGGIMWNNAANTAQRFNPGDVVNIRGKVNVYQNRLQIRVEEVLPMREEEYDPKDLVLVSTSAAEDATELQKILETVQNPHLKQLVDLFFGDADFVKRFSNAAAAKKWHHEYQGGLVRHCYEMARIAETMCELYPEIDRDLLLVGVFIHDIGKLEELSHDLYSDYTTAGKLLGHLQMGADMVTARVQQIPDFPEKLRLQLIHFVMSHHGELQFGSPVVPKTLEAIVLHHIDNLDAQAAAFTRIIREAKDRSQEWSDYQPLIERVVWTKDSID